MIDWKAIALAAARANAAYIEDRNAAQAAFCALGDTFIDQYQNGTHQAVLSRDPQGRTQLSISGTRGLSSKSLDLLDDVDLTPVSFERGNVAAGALEGCAALYTWANASARGQIDVQGHSLGGARTHLAPAFLAAAQCGKLYSFESPRFMDAAYYTNLAPALAGMVCTVNGYDPWAAWPWFDSAYVRPPLSHIWLGAEGFVQPCTPAQLPGFHVLAYGDHDMDGIAAKLAALALLPS
jgi:hypothetical protein